MEAVLLHASEFSDSRGVCRILDNLPFQAVRVFTLTEVPPEMKRGGHAHRTCRQIIYCAEGSFILNVTGRDRGTMTWVLQPGMAVHIPEKHWIILASFSPDAVCNVLASEQYTEPISDYEEFLKS